MEGTQKFRNKRTKDQKLADMVLIEQLAIPGKRQIDIAAEIAEVRPYALSRQQIQKDLQKLRREWLARSLAMIDMVKAKELAGLDEQERELWAAWERSKQDTIRQAATSESGGGAGEARQKQSVTKEGQCPNPAYMRLLLDIRDRRAKLLGLDVPHKQELTGSDGADLPGFPVARIVKLILPANGREQNDPIKRDICRPDGASIPFREELSEISDEDLDRLLKDAESYDKPANRGQEADRAELD